MSTISQFPGGSVLPPSAAALPGQPASPAQQTNTPRVHRSAFWLAFWLAVVLIGSKAVILGPPAEWSRQGISNYQRVLAIAAHQDVFFATAFGLIGQALLVATARAPRAHTAAWTALLVLGEVFVIFGVSSIWVFHFVGSPLTSYLLTISGGATHMWSSIVHFATPLHLLGVVGVPVAFGTIVKASPRLLRMNGPTRLARVACTAVVALGIAWAGFAHQAAGRNDWQERPDHQIALNPHWTLAASFFEGMNGSVAARIGGEFPAEYLGDFATVGERGGRASGTSTLSKLVPAGVKPPRNVIVVVIESCPTQHMSLYGSKYDSTPRLVAEERSGNAIVFDNFYCHMGLTANSLVAMSLSVYPPTLGWPVTARDPATPGVTVQQLLKPRGYRTACISSGDNEYLTQDQFLANRGFDDVWDCRDLEREIGCKKIFSWGVEDRCMVDGMLKWLDREPATGRPDGKPFYILGWTQQTHHPYEVAPGATVIDLLKGDAVPDPYDHNNYLNCLRTADEQIGRLLDELRKRGLADDTMVVVTGDHGEAFGTPHADIWGHGSNLYEENVHVPLMVWSPRLFKSVPAEQRRVKQIGSHVDLNPTLVDLMGLASSVELPPRWQGRSLFDADHPDRAYFLSTNGDHMVGVREGQWKYVLNVRQGREMLFDLSNDPREQVDVSREHPETCGGLRARLSAWVSQGDSRYSSPSVAAK